MSHFHSGNLEQFKENMNKLHFNHIEEQWMNGSEMVLLNSNIFIVYFFLYIALVLYSKLWASFERHFPSLRVVYPTLKFCKVMFLNISRKIHVLITKINCKALLRIFYFTLSWTSFNVFISNKSMFRKENGWFLTPNNTLFQRLFNFA